MIPFSDLDPCTTPNGDDGIMVQLSEIRSSLRKIYLIGSEFFTIQSFDPVE